MDGIVSPAALPASSEAASMVDITLLKKSQDLMASQAAALLATLPPPMSPNPPGVGGHIDIVA